MRKGGTIVGMVAFLLPAAAQSQSMFQGLGFLPGADESGKYSEAMGLSADGTVVVGQGNLLLGQTMAYRWTAAGGMVGLGLMPGVVPGGSTTNANAVSANGATIAGYGKNAAGNYEAFRWTQGTGIVTLGVLGGATNPFPNADSFALGMSSDGAVIVGFSLNASGNYEAMRWTAGGGMVGLGFLAPGIETSAYSVAYGASANGTVIVGFGLNASGSYEAFRWTQAAGLVGLGFIDGASGPSLRSYALGVSADGLVAVGSGMNLAGKFEAFRWSQTTGMVGLGFVDGATGPNVSSEAYSANANGSIIVGTATDASFNQVAFRWTQATGMRSLSGLLTAAGLNLGGWSLGNAKAITADGQFIAGHGTDPNGVGQAFVVRYIQAATSPAAPPPATTAAPAAQTAPAPAAASPVIAGMTTYRAVQQSVTGLAETRRAAGIHQHAFAARLLGAATPFGTGSEVGTFASVGSFQGGGQGRIAFGTGFTLIGGMAYQDSDLRRASITGAVIGALAARHVFDTGTKLRPFAEGGGWIMPDADLKFTRPYANGTGLAAGTGKTSGTIGYIYGRAGMMMQVTPANEFAVAAELGRQTFQVKGYSEPLTTANPFEAGIRAGTDRLDTAKLRGQWTHGFTDRLDGTVYAAGARALDQKSRLAAGVAGFGTVLPERLKRATWAEFGARLGYRITTNLIVDAHVDGVTGTSAGETRMHAGGGLRWVF